MLGIGNDAGLQTVTLHWSEPGFKPTNDTFKEVTSETAGRVISVHLIMASPTLSPPSMERESEHHLGLGNEFQQ